MITGFNKSQGRCDSIPCIFQNAFVFKTCVGLVVQNRKTSDSFSQCLLFSRYVKRDFLHFFNFSN